MSNLHLEDIAPRLAKARDAHEKEAWRGISRCWQNNGYHVYGAGPCFDTFDQAARYRARLDAEDTAGTRRARW